MPDAGNFKAQTAWDIWEKRSGEFELHSAAITK
jgi:hypothetical protein